MFKRISSAAAAAYVFSVLAGPAAVAEDAQRGVPTRSVAASEATVVHYRHADINGVKVFYREAGSPTAPTVVLLHGFPTSSNMFRNLIPALAARYHVIAPDYPGFGFSDVPERARFSYTFANLADVTRTLLNKLNAQHFALYVMDYGAPIGFRLASA